MNDTYTKIMDKSTLNFGASKLQLIIEYKDEKLAAVLERRPEPPSKIRPKTPGYVDALVMRSLDPDPEKRFQTCMEMKRACDEALDRSTKEGH